MKFMLRIGYYLLATLVVAVATIGIVAYLTLRSSLPDLEGDFNDIGLDAGFQVDRDAQGLVTITSTSRLDTAYALGFLHAQERFFQMDLLRRNSAGELSELFGSLALAHDSKMRVFRFRAMAEQVRKGLPQETQTLLQRYTQGVNRGLSELRVRPFEYLLLQKTPTAWREADTFLVLYSMYLDLQNSDGARERSLAVMQDQLPEDWYAFLTPQGGQWDAPLLGDALTNDLRIPETPWPFADPKVALMDVSEPLLPGSNNWAVGGSHTATGSAMVANDMHLGIRVPNTWYRASWTLDGRTISGATLPGTPAMIVGSNEHIAWGFTNSYGDWSDVVILETNPSEKLYQTPEGWENFQVFDEVVRVSGADPVKISVRYTRWGPVIGENHNGQLLALKWVALQPEGANFQIMNLESANTTDQALTIAAASGIPHQNFVVGDRDGNIGWTIVGKIPKRVGLNGTQPTTWADGSRYWDGYWSANDYPSVRNPDTDILWTANNRTAPESKGANIGNDGYALGARAQQIRDDLMALGQVTSKDLLAIQLDDRAVFLTRWHRLMSDVVGQEPPSDSRNALLSHLDQWQGRASADSVGYLLVKRFRETVLRGTVGTVYSALAGNNAFFDTDAVNNLIEYPVWALVTERPKHLIPLGSDSWDGFLSQAVSQTVALVTVDQRPIKAQTWGSHNRLELVHPLSSAVPGLNKLLDYPARKMDGDTFMPRVQGKSFGASQRMVVSPGDEASGIFHMATSQSGHPLSPYYYIGHDDWTEGNPSPLLPGPTKWTLRFTP